MRIIINKEDIIVQLCERIGWVLNYMINVHVIVKYHATGVLQNNF